MDRMVSGRANITEFQLGGTIIQPNVDALQEFKSNPATLAPIMATALRSSMPR